MHFCLRNSVYDLFGNSVQTVFLKKFNFFLIKI
jgi:hypothetical protein